MAEFDAYAANYRTLHNRSIRLSGETGEYFAEYKLNVLRRTCPPAPGDLIVDYGCGIGMLTVPMARAWPECRILGYDPSTESLNLAAQAVAGQPNVTLVETLSGVEGTARLVVCANVLHHVPQEERAGVVAQMARALAPGGRLVIFEHNPWNPLTRQAVANCPFDEGVVLLPRRETLGYVRESGLTVARKDFIVFFPAALRALRPLEPALGSLPLGAQYCVQGVRPETPVGANR
jgi:SAM-dependent methyltransferase